MEEINDFFEESRSKYQDTSIEIKSKEHSPSGLKLLSYWTIVNLHLEWGRRTNLEPKTQI